MFWFKTFVSVNKPYGFIGSNKLETLKNIYIYIYIYIVFNNGAKFVFQFQRWYKQRGNVGVIESRIFDPSIKNRALPVSHMWNGKRGSG